MIYYVFCLYENLFCCFFKEKFYISLVKNVRRFHFLLMHFGNEFIANTVMMKTFEMNLRNVTTTTTLRLVLKEQWMFRFFLSSLSSENDNSDVSFSQVRSLVRLFQMYYFVES